MNTNQAFKRLSFTISKQNKPNQNDLEALKTIAEYVDLSKKECLVEDYLFAKIYAYSFLKEVSYYKDSFKYGYTITQKQLHKILDSPLENILERTFKRLNDNEYEIYAKSIGLSIKHPALMTEEESKREKKIVSENLEELSKHAFGIMEYDFFEKHFTNQVTEAVNKYKSKV